MGDQTGHVASVPHSPRRNPWPVWLAGVMLRPTLWPYALGLLRSGGGNAMGWVGCKEVWPPFFLFHNNNDTHMHDMHAYLACSTQTGAEPQ